MGNVSCKHGWQNGIYCESASWKFAYSAHLQVNATMQSIQGKMHNGIVSFTSPLSICLRIRTIKLQKFTEKNYILAKAAHMHGEFRLLSWIGKLNRWNQACTLNNIVKGITGVKSVTATQILILESSVISGVNWTYFLDTTSIILYTWLLTLLFVGIFVCY